MTTKSIRGGEFFEILKFFCADFKFFLKYFQKFFLNFNNYFTIFYTLRKILIMF